MVMIMYKEALGLIETYGYVPAIEAADAALKAANVTLEKCEFVKGGLVTILIVGDVSAVKASVDAGEVAANRIGKVVSTTVIARTGEGLDKVFYKDIEDEKEDIVKKDLEKSKKELDEKLETDENKMSQKSKKRTMRFEDETIKLDDKEQLETMRVVDLRKMARMIEGFNMDNNQIKFAKKDELIGAIVEYSMKEG